MKNQLVSNIQKQSNINSQELSETYAKCFLRLLEHLDNNRNIKNITLMNNAKFCRNCLSKWLKEELEQINKNISTDDAKKIIYGMNYQEWKKNYF